VVVRLGDRERAPRPFSPTQVLQDLLVLTVRAAGGQQVPLAQIVAVESSRRPALILRRDRRRCAILRAWGLPDAPTGWAEGVTRAAQRVELPPATLLTVD